MENGEMIWKWVNLKMFLWKELVKFIKPRMTNQGTEDKIQIINIRNAQRKHYYGAYKD